MHSDAFYAFPQNVSSIADLLEAKNISWASYQVSKDRRSQRRSALTLCNAPQENMPYDGFTGFNYTEPNYLNKSAGDYTYYVRKHSPLILTDSVAGNPQRALRHRNFNDFAADVQADALPQWMFISPNLVRHLFRVLATKQPSITSSAVSRGRCADLPDFPPFLLIPPLSVLMSIRQTQVNDGHDTTIDFQSQWLEYFLYPLLADDRFNNNRTLVLLSYDENESYDQNNNVFTVALGKGIPHELVGTTDPTYYTHYSTLSTVEANWGLGSLGRGDTNKTLANVFSWVANATGYQKCVALSPLSTGVFSLTLLSLLATA